MNFHPSPLYQPIPVKAVIPRSLGTKSQRIKPWISADQPAATICKTEAGYQLKEGEIRTTWQMYRVLAGQERKNHFGLIKLDPERPSPTNLSGTGGTTTRLIHPYETDHHRDQGSNLLSERISVYRRLSREVGEGRQ